MLVLETGRRQRLKLNCVKMYGANAPFYVDIGGKYRLGRLMKQCCGGSFKIWRGHICQLNSYSTPLEPYSFSFCFLTKTMPILSFLCKNATNSVERWQERLFALIFIKGRFFYSSVKWILLNYECFFSGMRKEYKGKSEIFTEKDLKGKEPFGQFKEWFEEACNHPSILEANAVCLATATK